MNDNLLLGLVMVVALGVVIMLLRSRHHSLQRCPVCLRLGRADHYGRCRCSACGARFIVDATGRSCRSVWGAAMEDLAVLLLFLSYGLMRLFDRRVTSDVDLLCALAGVVVMMWNVWLAFRESEFGLKA